MASVAAPVAAGRKLVTGAVFGNTVRLDEFTPACPRPRPMSFRFPVAVLKAVILALSCLLLPLPSESATLTHTPQAVRSISRAYGFVAGQTLSLAQIEEAYPELIPQVFGARAAFNSAFPEVESRLEAELRAVFGEKDFDGLRRDMQEKVSDALQKQPLSAAQAAEFLAGVQSHARGEGLDPEIRDYLLAITYANEPSAEFNDGFRQRYRTDGSGKALGLRLHLQLPRSWSSTDGERKRAIRQWISEGGNGRDLILLDIRDVGNFRPSRAEIERFIAQGGARELAMHVGEVVEASAFSLESLPGYSAVLYSPVKGDDVVQTRIQMYQFFFRGKAIGLMCATVGAEAESLAVEQSFRRIQPLCRQVVNSLVIEQGDD